MRRSRPSRIGAAAIAATALLALGCDNDAGDDDAGDAAPIVEPGDHAHATRPAVTFVTGDTTIDGPAEVPAGFVDVHIDAGDPVGNHLLIVRLNDGVTLEHVSTAPDDQFFDLLTVVGGNGEIAAGEGTDLTLEFEPGNHVAFNLTERDGLPAATEFTVADTGNEAPAPDDTGTVVLGPEMRLTVPADFDAEGVWRFENRDEVQVHEAALYQLADGASVEDLIDWSHTFDGPPPVEGGVGSMGALGPDRQAWVDFAGVAPGDYALICWIPGDDGLPHLTQGMVAPVTVGGGGER
jgi:hypothetical protein